MSDPRPDDASGAEGNGGDGAMSSTSGVNPYSTGGGGVTFEGKVAVTYLAHLLVGDAAGGIREGHRVVDVAFQQAPDHRVDDLVLRAQRPEDSEPSLVLALAVRRSPNLVVSDERAQKLIRQYMHELVGSPAEGLEQRLGLAVAGTQTHASQLRELADLASAQMDARGFFDLIRSPGKFNEGIRGRLDQIEGLVKHAMIDLGSADTDTATVEWRTWQMLSRLSVLSLRIESGEEADWLEVANRLVAVACGRSLEGAFRLRDRLVALAGDYSPRAARVDLTLLRRDVHASLDPTVRRNQQGWQTLDHLRQRALASAPGEIVANDGRRRRLDRSDLAARLVAAAMEAEAMVVSGELGVGKSALVLGSLADAAREDPDVVQVVFINLRQVPILTVELVSILGCPLSALLSELSAPKRLLVVDGADAADEDRHDAFCYLVDAAREGGVGVVAVSGLNGRELVHDTLARRFGAGVAEHPVPLLSDTELDELVETFAELARFASYSESRDLLRQLRLVDRLVRGRVAGIPLTDATSCRTCGQGVAVATNCPTQDRHTSVNWSSCDWPGARQSTANTQRLCAKSL